MTGSRGPIRVLHLDDAPDLVDVVATSLEREDDRIEVRTATSPGEGLAVVADEPVDCFVLDYEMPGMTGIEALAVILRELRFEATDGTTEAITSGVEIPLRDEELTDGHRIARGNQGLPDVLRGPSADIRGLGGQPRRWRHCPPHRGVRGGGCHTR